jgi:hypothetical protein
MHEQEQLGIFHGTLVDLIKLVADSITSTKAHDEQGRAKTHMQSHIDLSNNRKRAYPEEVPLVSVCVQGGPGTVDTVLNAVVNGTPSLLVKGSGQAACLMSDAVLLKHTRNLEDQNGMFDDKQQALSNFITKELKMTRKQDGSFDYNALVNRLAINHKQLEHEKQNADWPRFRTEECSGWYTKGSSPHLKRLSTNVATSGKLRRQESIKQLERGRDTLQDAMRIEHEAALVVANVYGMRNQPFCVTDLLRKVFEAVRRAFCGVFIAACMLLLLLYSNIDDM